MTFASALFENMTEMDVLQRKNTDGGILTDLIWIGMEWMIAYSVLSTEWIPYLRLLSLDPMGKRQ